MRKKMKLMVNGLLVLAMMLALAGCGGQSSGGQGESSGSVERCIQQYSAAG